MTRLALCLLLVSTALAGGLYTAWIACLNHARARELDRLQREIEEAGALGARLRARAGAHVAGELDTPPVDELLTLPLEPYSPSAEPAR